MYPAKVFRTILLTLFLGVVLSGYAVVHAGNPASPIEPSDNIQDPGDPGTAWGGCGPSDSNCYVTVSGDLTDGDKGDITVSGAGTVWSIDANSITLGTDTTGDYVASFTAGGGLTGSASGEGSTPTLAVVSNNGGIVVNADDIALTLTSSADALSATTSSGSGLQVLSSGLTLLQGCSDGEILKWNETSDVWACAADASGGGSGNSFETIAAPSGTSPIADSATDTLTLTVTGTNLSITGDSSADSLTFDIAESVLAGSGLVANGSALDIQAGNGIQISSDSVALGALASNWSQTGAFDIVLDNASSEIQILESAGGAFYGTFDVGDLSANATYTFSGTSGTVLTSANYTSTLDSIYVNVGESPAAGDITGSFSGGLTVGTNSVALTTDTTGDYVASFTAGGGLTGSASGEGSTPTLAVVSNNGGIVVNADDIALTLTSSADALSATTSSGSGLQVLSSGLTLLQGCSDGEILKWNETSDVWACAADASGGGGLSDGDYGDIIVSGAGSVFSIDADVIDWADIADVTTLDASTSIAFGGSTYDLTFTNNGSGNEVHNLSSTGDFVIQDNGTASFTVNDSGNVLVATLDTDSTAPTTSGTTKMVITDANGQLSFDDIPTSGGSGTVNSGTQYRLGYYATTGTAISELSAITANRALVSDANGLPTHSSVTDTELGYLSGVTSAIQTQLGTKATISGTPVANQIALWNSATAVKGSTLFTISDALYPSMTFGASGYNAATFLLRNSAGTTSAISGDSGGLMLYGSSTYKSVTMYGNVGGTMLAQFQDLGGNLNINLKGRIYADSTNTAGSNLGVFNIDRTFSELSSGPNQHGYVDKTIFRYGAGAFNAFYAENTIGTTNAAYTQDHWAGFQTRITKDGANNVADLYEFVALGALMNGGSATNRYGFYMFSADNAGGGSLTNQYAIYIPSLTDATNSWTLYSIDAPSYHGGEFRIGASTDAGAYALQVTGDSIFEGGAVFNEAGADKDFRFESDTLTSAFAIDGATGNIIFGTLDTDATAPTISGTTKMVITDANGQLSFDDIPSGSGATTALDNLASVAINTSLLPGVNDTIDLGSDTLRFRDLYLGGDTLHIGTSTTDEGTIAYDTTGNIFNFGTDSTTNADIAFFTDDLYFDKSAGNIGIGDTSPLALLTVGSGDLFQVNSTGAIAAATGITSSGVLNFTAGTTTNSIFNMTSTGDFIVQDNGTSVFTVTDAGRIMLAPTAGQNITFAFTSNNQGRVEVNPALYTSTIGAIDIVRYGNFTGTAGSTAIELGIQPNLTVTEPGSGTFTWNGVDADFGTLSVTAGAGTSVFNLVRIKGVSDADAGTVRGVYVDTLTGTAANETAIQVATGWDYAAIFEGGNVGIGDTAPGYKLVVADTGVDSDIFSLVDSDGTCLHNPEAGSETVTCSSDERLKQDIVDAPSVLEYFNSFRVREYSVIASGDMLTGVIAQEVMQIHPELVTIGANGFYSVELPNQWKIVKAIQELDVKIESIKTLVDEPGGFLDNLRAWLADAANGIGDIVGGRLRANSEICVGATCITEGQLQELLQQAGMITTPSETGASDTDTQEEEIVPPSSDEGSITDQSEGVPSQDSNSNASETQPETTTEEEGVGGTETPPQQTSVPDESIESETQNESVPSETNTGASSSEQL